MNRGDRVADFELPDQTGTTRTLTELLADGPIVLFFYPAAMTPGCTKEACHFRDLAGEFAALGHGGQGGGTEQGQASAAAQGAALGLLNKFGGARIAKGLGLDELSIGSSEYGMQGSQVVNLGKEITDRLTVGYEQSLAGAESVLKLTYQLSRSWTVVLRGGAVTGVDLSYNKRFDGDRK